MAMHAIVQLCMAVDACVGPGAAAASAERLVGKLPTDRGKEQGRRSGIAMAPTPAIMAVNRCPFSHLSDLFA